VAVCPFSQGEWNETHGSSKAINSNNATQKKNDNSPKIEINEGTTKYQSNILNSKSSTVESVNKNTKVESNAKSQNNTKNSQEVASCKTCPHTGIQGYYTISVRRIEETKLSTLSEFSILDPSGKKVLGYEGYIIEREGPDTVEPLRKKRIIAGTHELRWHYRGEPRNYWAIGVFNHQKDNRGLKKELIHPERWILIHPGTSRGSSIGCLIIAKNYYRDGLIHRCDKSKSFEFMKKIISYTVQVEGKKLKNHEVLRKFKLKVSNEFRK